jgi:hypothetical protein
MSNPEKNPTEGLFSPTDDYIKLTEVSRKYPTIHEVDLNSKEHYEGLIEISKTDSDIIPLFVKNEEGNLTIIPSHSSEVDIAEDSQLVYLGKKIQREEKEEDYDETVDEEEAEQEIKEEKEKQKENN